MKRFARFFLQESKFLYETDIKSVLRFVHRVFVRKAEDDKRPRDPRPTLIPHPGQPVGYVYNPIQFALLSKDRRIINNPTHCRDYMNDAIRYHVSGMHSAHCNHQWPGELDMHKLRMVFFYDVSEWEHINVFDGIKNGVRLANMYGRVAGWSPLRLVRAKIPYEKNDKTYEKECYVLVGDRNWQRTPQYMSMLILLIRICIVHEVPKWITDAYALTGYWYEFLYNTDTKDRPSNSDINTFLANSYDHMLVMMTHDREIFPGNMLGNFSSKLDNFHNKSGINSLINKSGCHPESAKKLSHYYATEVLKYGRSD